MVGLGAGDGYIWSSFLLAGMGFSVGLLLIDRFISFVSLSLAQLQLCTTIRSLGTVRAQSSNPSPDALPHVRTWLCVRIHPDHAQCQENTSYCEKCREILLQFRIPSATTLRVIRSQYSSKAQRGLSLKVALRPVDSQLGYLDICLGNGPTFLSVSSA